MLAASWIFGSDTLLSWIAQDARTLVILSKLKGTLFVLVTSIGLYFLVSSSFAKLERARRIALEQKTLLEMIATSRPLTQVLEAMIDSIENLSPGIRCSVLRVEDGKLHHLAAPNLPADYCTAIDGMPIGPQVGACGSAAFSRSKVYCNDIAQDPTWASARDLALRHNLRACWSTPILEASGKEALATFAIYSSQPGPPSAHQETLFELATYLGAIALEQERSREALLESQRHLEELVTQRTLELQDALVRAQAADRIKSAFLATMSHELRTPLNSIIGFTGLLRQELPGPLNEEQKKQLGMIGDSSRHLLALINDVLDISKIEAGQLETTRERFSVREVLDSVFVSLQPQAQKKDLEFITRVAPDVQEVVSDPRRFRQVVLNLLNNALKFTDRGRVVLEASLEQCDIGPRLRVTVEDTGIGIRERDFPRIFQAFSQVDTGLSRAHEGTGLGLAICQRLVKLLGGTIGLHSEWGRGSSFTFTIPLDPIPIRPGDTA